MKGTVVVDHRDAVCEWCRRQFATPVRPGRAPRYCRRSHRQRAYEARLDDADAPALDHAAVDALTQALGDGDVHRLVAAAIDVVASTGRTEPTWSPAPDRPRRQSGSGRTKPWKVTLHRTGADPQSGQLYTAHTTRRAADTARRQLADIWQHHQHRDHVERWTWSMVDDVDDTVDGVALERDAARDGARRIVVDEDQPGLTQTYRRQVAPHRPDVATIDCVAAGGQTSSLSARMRKTPNAYGTGAMAGTELAGHPYAVDLLSDAVNAGPGDLPGSAIDRLASQATDLAAELLPDGDTWELDAATIRRWLTDRGVIRTLEDRWPPGSRA